jgi:hypothetical protein
MSGAVEDATELVNRLTAWELKGRASTGLVHFGKMIVAAHHEQIDAALSERVRTQELWEKTMTRVAIAEADAVTARVLPDGHPVAVVAAHAADQFFSSNGYKAHLDLYSDVLARYREASEEIAV